MRWPTRRHSRSSSPEPSTWTCAFNDLCESRDPGLTFEVSAHLEWQPSHPGPAVSDAPRIAGRMARGVIEKALVAASVLRMHAAEQDLVAALRDELPLRSDSVTVLAVSVSLRAEEHVLAAARRRERAQHELDLDDIDRRQARARMEFLRDELLADPSSTRLYSLLQLSPRLGGPPPGSDPDELVRQVHQWHPRSRWVLVAQTLQTFLDRLSEDNAQDLLKILHSAMEALGNRQLAADLTAAKDHE